MKRVLFFGMTLCALLLSGCQKNEVLENEPRSIEFRVVNYEQYVMGGTTRAESVNVLDHLSMAVFTADTDQLVGSVITQNKGDSGYGTFTVALEEGTYRIVFLGYMGSKALQMTSSKAISFADSYVPHTFLYSETLRVDENVAESQNIVLNRAVGAFRLVMADMMPEGIYSVQFVSDRGGAVLNAQTGECTQNSGRSYTIELPNPSTNWWNKTGANFTLYYFLPTAGASMNLTVNALDNNGAVVKTRTFEAAPMAINQLTSYTGDFFVEPSTDLSMQLSVNNEWAEEKEFTY